MSADRIETAGRILILLGGVVLAGIYFAAAIGFADFQPSPFMLFLTGLVILLYAIGEATRKTYQQGYEDGIDMVLTGMPDAAREVVEAQLEKE